MAKTTPKKKETVKETAKDTKKKSLVIVESPAKAKTIKKILGDSYEIKASVGHIRDLPTKKLGVDLKNNFEPEYEVMEKKQKVVDELSASARNSYEVFLAPDPDREGEAIAWHMSHLLSGTCKNIYRIEFNEITKTAIQDAVKNPRPIDMNRVNAQQTRRILDRLVGYKISPILWKNVGKGLSAGRVQSVAVRIICDREKEIEAFVPQEYWKISADLSKLKSSAFFNAELTKFEDKKIEVNNAEDAAKAVSVLEAESTQYVIDKVTNRQTQRKPQPPFITSTLQREGSSKLGYSVKRTMQLAQNLYEGIELGASGHVGLITYMRTDSTRISDEAKDAAKEYIVNHYGEKYYPKEARVYAKKGKNVQDAHEAIRPTYIEKTPESVRQYLSSEQYRLYKLIWSRFIASQMESANVSTVAVEIGADKYTLRASSSKLTFDGFLIVYDDREENEKDSVIPDLEKGDKLKLKKVNSSQHFTQPPPRYSEATLVKTLEELGVGRPSTYAPTIATIQDRGYVIKEDKSLVPTPLGKTVNELLVQHFPDVVSSDFTANMENHLDEIETDKADWKGILGNFYEPFEVVLKKAQKEIQKVEILTEHECPECGKPMALKTSRFGSQFLGCSGYPECKSTKPLSKDMKPLPDDQPSDEICEKCGSGMLIKQGPYGEYLGCSNQECKYKKKIIKKTGVNCPQEGCDGELLERKSRYGKVFYGCSKYPACNFALWNEPNGQKCPECGSMLVNKYLKRGNKVACSKKECTFEKPME
ncbi:MAG TPA: type I DNA topoisomerase [Candidatus Gastranaerophilales bacterium]|nr:type I DNA topoisomerase [Candidatus Gastranaerophilales bacterium]